MLADHHLALLAARAVTGHVVERRGYSTITDAAELEALGFSPKQARQLVPGLHIPLYALNGKPATFSKFRPDGLCFDRHWKQIKYASVANSWGSLDALPGTILSADLWVSPEGFIKADAMTAVGLPVVAFDGIYGWLYRGEPLVGLEALARPGRWFHVVCDSDYRTNPQVAGAMCRLAKWLRSEGAKVRILHPPGEQKVGVDDFLAAGGSMCQLVEAGRPSLVVRRAWALQRFARPRMVAS